MAKTVEISDELHETFALAENEGLALAEYVARELAAVAANATLLEHIRSRVPVHLDISAAELIREGREERTDQILDAILSR